MGLFLHLHMEKELVIVVQVVVKSEKVFLFIVARAFSHRKKLLELENVKKRQPNLKPCRFGYVI